jgi:hypothetical protein
LNFGEILGNARAERDHHPVLEVLDSEASFFSFFSPHPEVPLLSIAIDGQLSTSALIIMIVALVSTKLPILVGHDVSIFHLAQDIKRTGFWSMMHEARADLTMLLGCLYLLIVGAGRWSFDARMQS